MNISEYKSRFGGDDEAAPGWDAIDQALTALHGEQEPLHWGTVLSAALGGNDPLEGISAYQSRAGGRDHLHFCTYGFSELFYSEEAVGGDFSRFGFEMTFRLASALPPAQAPNWVCNLLQNIARYVFSSGKWFEAGHWIPANGPIRADAPTDIVGLAFIHDPELPAIQTPHGRVEFLQAVGLTSAEVADLKAQTRSCQQIIEAQQSANPMLITDLARRSYSGTTLGER